MTKALGTSDLIDRIGSRVDKATGLPPLDGGAAGTEPTPEDWQQFTKLLEAGDMVAARRFAADFDLPLKLLPTLALIRPEFQRLGPIVEAGQTAEQDAADLNGEIESLIQCRPPTAKDAADVAIRLTEARGELETAKKRLGDAANAHSGMCALKTYFPEFISDLTAVPLVLAMSRGGGCGLPSAVATALHVAGFKGLTLQGPSWRELFRRAPEPKRRRRLVARK